MLVVVYSSLFLLAILGLVTYFRLRVVKDGSAKNPTFIQFLRSYIPFYIIIVLGDWLQGPYLYRLYHYHGFVETQVAIIYVCGMVSSALVFPAKDVIANSLGRKRTIIASCVLYAVSCLATAIPNYGVLLIGRCLSGLSNTLLFSTLESWYVHEHVEHFDFPKEWILVTFSHVGFASSIAAIVAGILADVFARWFSFGPVSPFLLACPVFLVAVVPIFALWNENFGEKQKVSRQQLQKSCSQGLKTIAQNVDIFLIGTIQSLFESVLFVFVFIWTPALDIFHDIPLGIAFASFMVCFLVGSLICDYLIAKVGYPMTRVLLVVTSCASAVFLMAALFARDKTATLYRLRMLICLQLFELLCGFYFPIMRTLRKEVLPEEHQLSIINWFRVPLTILSSLALLFLHDASGGVPEIFLFCAVMMLLAAACSFRFTKFFTVDHTPTADDSETIPA